MKKAYCSYLVINPIFNHVSNFDINWFALSWYSKVCWGGGQCDSSAMCSSLFPASKAHLWMRSLGDTGAGGSCLSHYHLHPKNILLEKVGVWEVWTKECDLMQCLCIILARDGERCNFSSIRQNFIWDHDYKVAGSKTSCFSWHSPVTAASNRPLESRPCISKSGFDGQKVPVYLWCAKMELNPS